MDKTETLIPVGPARRVAVGRKMAEVCVGPDYQRLYAHPTEGALYVVTAQFSAEPWEDVVATAATQEEVVERYGELAEAVGWYRLIDLAEAHDSSGG